MYILPPRNTLADAPVLGGPMTQFDIHDLLCSDRSAVPRFHRPVRPDETCPAPFVKQLTTPMIHVWIRQNRCGPFALIGGNASGTVSYGEKLECDPQHGSRPRSDRRVIVVAMERDEVRRFAELWWSEQKTTFFANRWMGVPTLQHPFDAWITQEIICEVQPELIIECGSYRGGSAIMWAMLLEQLGTEGRVLTIDIDGHLDRAKAVAIFGRRVDTLTGSTVEPAILEQVRAQAAGKRTLVILDSDHSKDHVVAELDAYAPLVSPGSYMIVQDGVVNGHPVEPGYGPGPYEALEEFLQRDDRFEVDMDRQRMLFTFNPKGFLRRRGDLL